MFAPQQCVTDHSLYDKFVQHSNSTESTRENPVTKGGIITVVTKQFGQML